MYTCKICKNVQEIRNSDFISPIMQGAKCKILHHFAFLHLICLQVPIHSVFITSCMEGAKCNILHIYKCAIFCIVAHQKCASTNKTQFLSPTIYMVQMARSCKPNMRKNKNILASSHLHTKCKVQDLA